MIKPNSMAWDYIHNILPKRRKRAKLLAQLRKTYKLLAKYTNKYIKQHETEYGIRIADPEYNTLIKELDNLAFEITKLTGF